MSKNNTMKKIQLIFSFLICLSTISTTQKTYTKDIANIIYDKCTSCHRPNEIGPFTLTSYEDVINRSSIIKEVVSTGYMPPWQPDPDYNHFIGEYFLTDIEKQNIIEWIDEGMEFGNSTEEPELPNFPEGSLLGEPDLVLEFEVEHIHEGNNKDEYRYFVLPTGLLEDKVIKAVELRPGNSKVVHHALFFQDTEGRAASFDAQTPEYGFEGFGGFGTDEVLSYDQYPGYVPGTKPIYYPDGLGQVMEAGADLVIQMHYAPWPVDVTDKSKVNIFFADEDEVVDRYVDDRLMLPFDLPGGFFEFILPPDQKKEFHGRWNLTVDRSLIGLSPHMHFLGTSWEVWLENPDGSTVNLIKIDDWDFNWQGSYYFQKLIPAMAGSTVHAVATYDNTANNPQNPSDPPIWVTWGEDTKDEMYYLPILSIPYRDGDENIIFETSTTTSDPTIDTKNWIQPIYPNPIDKENITIDFHLDRGTSIAIRIIDINGRLIRTIRKNEYFNRGDHTVTLHMNSLSAGTYFVQISNKTLNLTSKLIKK